MPTVAEMATLNDLNVVDAGATDVFNDAPFIAALEAIPATNGITHSYLKQTAAPVVGFRSDPNNGIARGEADETSVTVTLKVLDASYDVAKAFADVYRRGQPNGGPDAYMAMRGMQNLKAAFRKGEEQLFYGATAEGDSDGFTGMADALGNYGLAMVHNAGGNGTGGRTSVWAIRTTDDEANANLVLGNGANIEIGEYFEQTLDGANSQPRPSYVQHIEGWMGMQIGGARSIGRLCNVGGDVTLNDALMGQLYNLFPEEAPPTHFVMNRHALEQLRSSRTATNVTGAEAPFPTQWENVPIIKTGSVKNDEAAVPAS